jgi:hypothetical protein
VTDLLQAGVQEAVLAEQITVEIKEITLFYPKQNTFPVAQYPRRGAIHGASTFADIACAGRQDGRNAR